MKSLACNSQWRKAWLGLDGGGHGLGYACLAREDHRQDAPATGFCIFEDESRKKGSDFSCPDLLHTLTHAIAHPNPHLPRLRLQHARPKNQRPLPRMCRPLRHPPRRLHKTLGTHRPPLHLSHCNFNHARTGSHFFAPHVPRLPHSQHPQKNQPQPPNSTLGPTPPQSKPVPHLDRHRRVRSHHDHLQHLAPNLQLLVAGCSNSDSYPRRFFLPGATAWASSAKHALYAPQKNLLPSSPSGQWQVANPFSSPL